MMNIAVPNEDAKKLLEQAFEDLHKVVVVDRQNDHYDVRTTPSAANILIALSWLFASGEIEVTVKGPD